MKRMWTLLAALLPIVWILSSGLVFFNEPVELDPGKHPVYQVRTVDDALNYLDNGGKDSAFALIGKIDDIGKKYDSFRLSAGDGKKSIECHISNEDPEKAVAAKNKIAELSPGDRITAFGSVKKKILGGGYNAEITLVSDAEIKDGEGVCATDEKTLFSNENTVETEIVNPGKNSADTVRYRIPSEWKKVERELDNKGDHIYGYRYNLNRLKGEKQPEALYVFYFDYNKNLADRSQYDDIGRIEAAIVKNILNKDDVGKCPESGLKSHYGTEYHYYDDKYESRDDRYHLEFVFRENGTKGMLVLMYIYRLPDRADEIMYMMRSTEISEQKQPG